MSSGETITLRVTLPSGAWAQPSFVQWKQLEAAGITEIVFKPFEDEVGVDADVFFSIELGEGIEDAIARACEIFVKVLGDAFSPTQATWAP